jgi:uncharacterized RDD family membrane protein YckC
MNEPHLASAEFGGFWLRFLAVLADSAIVFLVMTLILAGAVTTLGEGGLALGALAGWLFAFLYWPAMHASGLQATFGKAMLGLRVTGYQGNRISFLRALGRELAKILSGAVLMVGYLLAAFTARKQALHDLVGSTYVVREGKASVAGALATIVAGVLLPVGIVAMGIGGPMASSLMAMVGSMKQEKPQPAMKAAPRSPVVAAPKPKPAPAPATPAPEVAQPAPEVAKPVLVAEKAAAPLPLAAQPVPVAVDTPAPPPPPVLEPKVVEPAKAEPKQAEPKKPVAKKAAPRPRRAALAKAPAVFEPKAPGPKFNDLVTAVLYGDAQAVAELLKFGRWVDKPDSRGATPLMLAVQRGDRGSAEALLRAGADASRAVAVAEVRRDGAMLDLLKRYVKKT